MEFEDFFEKKNKYHYKPGKQRNYYDDSYKYGPRYKDNGSFNLLALINSIKNNKKIRVILLIAVIVIIAAIIGLLLVLFPLVLKVIDFISKNGISGVLDAAIGFLEILWNGPK